MTADVLRVLHVVPYFPPDRVGGVGEVVAHLHRGLLAEGHDSLVLTGGTSRQDPRVIRVASTPAGFVLGCGWFTGRARDRDILHCHHGDALALLLGLRLRRPRVPVLATFHVGARDLGRAFRPYHLEGRTFGRSARNWAYRHLSAPVHQLFDRLTLRLADEASFISNSSARDLLGPARAESARVIYNGLPDPDGGASREKVEPAELLYVGAPGDRKRVNALPFVLRAVRAAIPRARLRIAGFRMEHDPDLRALFREFGLEDGVVCEGRVRSDELGPYYRAAGVLLVPSAHEGLPMVILEAFQNRLPCVATRVSGHPEIIRDGVNGYLVDLDRPDQMAARCLEILRNPTLRQSMGEAGREAVAGSFTLPRQLSEYLQLYRRMTAR